MSYLKTIVLAITFLWAAVLPQVLYSQLSGQGTPSQIVPLPSGMKRLDVTGIENLIQVTDGIYSGGEPTLAGLEHLQVLGVKILVSVDGLTPDREAAEKLGMSYVHIPLGYDGIDSVQLQDFVTLMTQQSNKIFFHCHHGKHRGPAAVAACLLIAKKLSKEQAIQFMRGAGTAKEYAGLYRSIEELNTSNHQPQEFSQLLKKSRHKSMAQWMAELDRAWEIVQEQQKSAEADIDPDQLKIMAEAFRESARVAGQDKDLYGDPAATEKLIRWLSECEKETREIQGHVLNKAQQKARVLIKALAKNCVDCHTEYRN
jgi:protein tyrosine phosphatase (PTP) superfamily phosphohydrolase (DUF442 family)